MEDKEAWIQAAPGLIISVYSLATSGRRQSFSSSIPIFNPQGKILIGSDEVLCSLRANYCGHIHNVLLLTISGHRQTANTRKGAERVL